MNTDEGPLRFGVRIPPCDRVDRVARTVRRAEDLGFDQVWFPDSQLLWRDVFTTLTAAALGTERIGLGTAVTNVATRHPSVVASAARIVAELAPGRFTLGLGVGNSSVGPVGPRQTSSAQLREGLALLRALLDGQDWDFEGKVRSRLRDPQPSVPIHLAVSGPRNLRPAGEIADGVILLSGVSPRTLAAATARVREGAEAVGRSAKALPVTVSAFCAVTDDIAAEARLIKPICASIAQNGGAPSSPSRGSTWTSRRRWKAPIRISCTPRTGTRPSGSVRPGSATRRPSGSRRSSACSERPLRSPNGSRYCARQE
jgi:5,10-methylenetetrahydromethanopterin reductase